MARSLGIVTGMHMRPKRGFNQPTQTISSGYAGQLAQERVTGFQEGLNPLKKVLELFGPSSGKGIEKNILADINADFISRGLGSTTLPGAMSANVKMQTEDIRKNRLASALAAISQYIQQSTPQPGDITTAGEKLRAGWIPATSNIFGTGQTRRW